MPKSRTGRCFLDVRSQRAQASQRYGGPFVVAFLDSAAAVHFLGARNQALADWLAAADAPDAPDGDDATRDAPAPPAPAAAGDAAAPALSASALPGEAERVSALRALEEEPRRAGREDRDVVGVDGAQVLAETTFGAHNRFGKLHVAPHRCARASS